jgi:hypothetical protein
MDDFSLKSQILGKLYTWGLALSKYLPQSMHFLSTGPVSGRGQGFDYQSQDWLWLSQEAELMPFV